MTARDDSYARPFRITAPGHDRLDGRHGVQFPSGYCVLDVTGDGLGLFAATGLEHLALSEGAIVEWFDGRATARADERRKVAEEIAQRIHDRFDHLIAPEHESMRVVAEWCEREAREIGGAS